MTNWEILEIHDTREFLVNPSHTTLTAPYSNINTRKCSQLLSLSGRLKLLFMRINYSSIVHCCHVYYQIRDDNLLEV